MSKTTTEEPVDAALEALLKKYGATPQGAMRLTHITREVCQIGVLLDTPHREVALGKLAEWQESNDELRKGVAGAWLARAAGKVAAGAKKAVAAVGNAGEKAGRAYGKKAAAKQFSPVRRDVATKAARDFGEGDARANHYQRVALGDKRAGRAQRPTGGFVEDGGSLNIAPPPHPETIRRAGNEAANRAGARFDNASAAHAETYARMGRKAATRGLAIGASLGAVAAGAQAVHHLSEAQVNQRKNAAKSRWLKDGHATNVGGNSGAGNTGHWNA